MSLEGGASQNIPFERLDNNAAIFDFGDFMDAIGCFFNLVY